MSCAAPGVCVHVCVWACADTGGGEGDRTPPTAVCNLFFAC